MIETLFFYAYYAFLDGDLEKTRMYYEFLKNEFGVSGKKGDLSIYQWKELKNIRSALDTGTVPVNKWVSEDTIPDIKEKENPDIKQVELVKKIHVEAVEDLKKCLSSDTGFHLYNIEHPCDPHGRVDMVYKDDITIYPTEIKRQEGRHDLLGQIAKYTLYFKTLLHLKMFKIVQPVTICRTYDKHTLAELKRMSVSTLRYNLVNDVVTIHTV